MSKLIDEIRFTQELIKKPSVTPKDLGAMNVVVKHLKKLGFKCKLMSFQEKGTDKIINLYAKYGNQSPNLCFAGHTDVVPAGDVSSWSTKPFGAKIKKGYLYGRGVSDMKGGIGCFIAAVSQFLKENKNFKGSISFLITGDEESVAINGTKKVVEYLKKKKEKIDFCIVGEPSNRSKLGQMMKIGRRGSITTHLTVIGKQGHIAYPLEALNPATPIIKILDELKSKPLDKGNKNFQPSNLEITKISIDNSADNVIPAKANATFNIRYNTLHTFSSLKKYISKIIKKYEKKYKCKTQSQFQGTGTAFLTKPNQTVKKIQSIIKKETKQNTVLSTIGGTSDARFIKDIAPCIEFGLVGNTMHQVDERSSIKDMKKLKSIYLKIIKSFFN
ncbi:MAG: succinyl-diaminopimelate desuccinylase [Pelagibacteraceae bacterium]|nr:succinyl-diaminopimelate desuccinylase [Pelagibacteraceae bacterium]MCI5079760.1 succinyl-diaminopimelate desuccinylase [Pelagibacteraceae bacterium]